MIVRHILETSVFILILIFVSAITVSAGGGQERSTQEKTPKDQAAEQKKTVFEYAAEVEYARHFTLEYERNYKVLQVKDPWQNAEETFTYVLYPRGGTPPEEFERSASGRVTFIEIPVRSIVTMSTSYLAHLDMISELDTLAAVDNFRFIYSPEVRKMAEEGTIREVGSGPEVNVELLYEMEPEVIMTYGLGTQYDSHPKLMEAGLDVVINADHTELTPLGRSEWIKFIAAFYNKEKEASELFDKMVGDYTRMAKKARNVTDKPTVLNNAPYQGAWWIAGGNSFAARFIEDAGGDYLWSDNPNDGSIKFDFEAVFEKAVDADYWINPGTWNSPEEALAEDERYAEFKAFREMQVYNNNRRMNEYGFSDYWESGVARPDVVLADLIKIFHPELVPDHEFVYYKKLK